MLTPDLPVEFGGLGRGGVVSDWMKNLKDGFFVVGSLAGLFAFLRPAAESKFQRDIDRATTIISKLDEERLMRLPLLV
jgi:hypothetical protein